MPLEFGNRPASDLGTEKTNHANLFDLQRKRGGKTVVRPILIGENATEFETVEAVNQIDSRASSTVYQGAGNGACAVSDGISGANQIAKVLLKFATPVPQGGNFKLKLVFSGYDLHLNTGPYFYKGSFYWKEPVVGGIGIAFNGYAYCNYTIKGIPIVEDFDPLAVTWDTEPDLEANSSWHEFAFPCYGRIDIHDRMGDGSRYTINAETTSASQNMLMEWDNPGLAPYYGVEILCESSGNRIGVDVGHPITDQEYHAWCGVSESSAVLIG